MFLPKPFPTSSPPVSPEDCTAVDQDSSSNAALGSSVAAVTLNSAPQNLDKGPSGAPADHVTSRPAVDTIASATILESSGVPLAFEEMMQCMRRISLPSVDLLPSESILPSFSNLLEQFSIQFDCTLKDIATLRRAWECVASIAPPGQPGGSSADSRVAFVVPSHVVTRWYPEYNDRVSRPYSNTTQTPEEGTAY